MGGKDSSSKRKSSKRKRDRISSKKKSKRKEPKKRHRIYDSVTSDSDGDSINSDHSSSPTLKSDKRKQINKNKKRHHDTSLSSYSDYESLGSDSDSENAKKSRKARRPRVGLKDRKRRGRKRFTSIHGDVDPQNVRKRKTLDRDRVVKPIKKSLKKKSRKYSSSFSSSDSESCSTCQSKSSRGTADGKRRRSKVIPDKEIERQPHKRRRKHEERSPSYSSYDRGNNPSDGALLTVNSSRRLRSVIAVVNQPQDEGENRWEMDLHNEEIVYDQNDYPSPKSVDSNEGGDRMDSGNHSHGGLGLVEKEKEIDVNIPRGDLLESILRQKALENLRKFKGRCQTDPRSSVVEMNNVSDVETTDVIQNNSINHGDSNAHEIDERKRWSSDGDISLMKEVKKLEHIERDDDVAKQSFIHQPNEVALLECSEEDKSATFALETSSAQPNSGEHCLEQGNEAKDGSQFEQKTMSVMRGGEVVQVSYKVFIPKNVPPSARRQLRR